MPILNLINTPISNQKGFTSQWPNLYGSAKSLAIANLAISRPILVVTNNSSEASRLEREIRFYQSTLTIKVLPDWETLPYEAFSPHQDIISERLASLYQLDKMQSGVLIVSITTLMHRLAPQQYLKSRCFVLDCGDKFDSIAMRRNLQRNGYHAVDTVSVKGEFAARGSIFDIYPVGTELPYRIDLFDDEIDNLRTFDPESQRSLEKVESIRLLPAREYPLDADSITDFRNRWHNRFDVDHRRCPIYLDISNGIPSAGAEYYLPLFFEHCETLFDLIPEQTLIVNFQDLDSAAANFWSELNARYEQHNINPEHPLLAPKEVFIPTEEIFHRLNAYARAEINWSNSTEQQLLPPADLSIDESKDNPAQLLADCIPEFDKLLICAESAGRMQILSDLLARNNIHPKHIEDWQSFTSVDNGLFITVAELDEGFASPSHKLAVIAESQLFGHRIQQRRRRKKKQDQSHQIIHNLAELSLGDAVVHIEHGVGRYQGLISLANDGEQTEFLMIHYADDAKLYVPVTSLHLINHFSGADKDLAPLHKLGSDQWSKAKRKATEKVRDAAAQLLQVYAKRESKKGHAMRMDKTAYQAFCSTFPFEETADQQDAIDAVIADMTMAKSMDRLVCGDVGFGKTEVAMRAAFIAVSNSKQVAILVPTTLLAQQHYESFKDRFANQAVSIEVLSRFRSAKEQQKTLLELAQGKVDIIIGTHKLLQKDVQYKNLGLLVIDEEHRFGVRQKEQLKALRAEVDILNLTATPIPRTLNMSMSGIRDLSIITTAPEKRLSIKTFVRQSDTHTIKDAIQREILRGGQIYYLHNEVSTIEKTATDLQTLLPDLRIGIAHGQMRERELEQVMSDFYHKRFQLLVCTTIIETGIDVPNANTIIMDRADKLGLAQLHQLRGRVGRSHHQAYAYLLTGHPKSLTKDAAKRLEAISLAEDLGAGFTLASHDLEIRGAGELLGEEQSGQIQTVGFSMYMDMLDRAVKSLKAGESFDDNLFDTNTNIDLHLSTIIPDDYLPDVNSRLTLYKRIANATDEHALRELQVEMIDRFGLLPESVKNLFRITAIKLQVAPLGIDKLSVTAKGGAISFAEKTCVHPLVIIDLIQYKPEQFQMAGGSGLKFVVDLADSEARFEFVEALLKDLAKTPETA